MPDGASGRSGLQAGSRAGPPLSLSTLEARRGPAGAPARARDTEDLSKPPAGGGASVRRGRGRVRAEVTRSRLPRRSDWDCGAGRPRLRGGGVGGHLSDGARAPRGGGGMFLGPGPGERRQEAQARAAGEPGGEGRPGHGTAGVGRGGRRDADSALPAPVPSRALTRRGRGPGLRLGLGPVPRRRRRRWRGWGRRRRRRGQGRGPRARGAGQGRPRCRALPGAPRARPRRRLALSFCHSALGGGGGHLGSGARGAAAPGGSSRVSNAAAKPAPLRPAPRGAPRAAGRVPSAASETLVPALRAGSRSLRELPVPRGFRTHARCASACRQLPPQFGPRPSPNPGNP